jgi:hypothetical protein
LMRTIYERTCHLPPSMEVMKLEGVSKLEEARQVLVPI